MKAKKIQEELKRGGDWRSTMDVGMELPEILKDTLGEDVLYVLGPYESANEAKGDLQMKGYAVGSTYLSYPIVFKKDVGDHENAIKTKHGDYRSIYITKWDRIWGGNRATYDQFDGAIFHDKDRDAYFAAVYKDPKVNESKVDQMTININVELTDFLKAIVIPESNGMAKDERSAAALLMQILKKRYKL